jgi:tetratricopeptide (TPR) repeat protein
MRIGEKARFFCQPQYAETYIQLEATLRQHRINGGQKRSNNHSRCAGHCSEELEACRDLDVLFGCPLEFEIHLLNVLQPGDYEKEIWEMTMDEKWQACWRLKESGNSQYRSKKHRKSANDYSKAIEILDSIATALAAPGAVATLTRDQVIDLRSTCRLNLAACALQLKEYAVTVQLCSAVLESDKSNPKALFRRAQARIRLGRDLDEAAQDLDTVCTIAAFTGVPSTAELQVESKLLQQKENQVSDKEKAMFGNIFWKNHSVAPVDE